VEDLGYIYPRVLRSAIAEKWADPTVEHTYSLTENKVNSLIKGIMELHGNASSDDRAREDIQEMRALLHNLDLDGNSKIAGSPKSHLQKLPPPQQPHAMQMDYPTHLQTTSLETFDEMSM